MTVKRVLRPLVYALRSVLGTNGLAAGLVDVQRSLRARELAPTRADAPPPPAIAWPVALPPGMRTLHIPGKDARRPGFDLVIPECPGRYDQLQMTERHYSDVASILAFELGGAGTLIDLGANIGTVALPVAASGSRVVAVEMVPTNYLRLVLASLVNQLAYFWPVNAAASSADGTLRFAGAEAWASVAPDGQEVVSLRLDTVLATVMRQNPSFLRPPFALKIDVEGHDYDALLGGRRLLAEYRPTVMFESIQLDVVREKTLLCKRMLADAGYELFMLRDQLLVPKQPDDVQEELVGDFLAMPRERVGAMAGRFPGFEIRQPTVAERVRWLETLLRDTHDHRRHARAVIDALAPADLAFARASAGLRAAIEKALVDDGEIRP